MSTRATIKYAVPGDRYAEGYHLYNELTDDNWLIHLEVPRDALVTMSQDSVVIAMPVSAWSILRQGSKRERYLEMDPHQLHWEACDFVDERMAKIAADPDPENSIHRFLGCLLANPDDSRDKQIIDYIKNFLPPKWVTDIKEK